MADREQVVLAILEHEVRALGLVVYPDGGQQWRQHFPVVTVGVAGHGDADTGGLEARVADIFITRRHIADFCLAYFVRAALTGHVALEQHVQLAIFRVAERPWVAETPERVLGFGLIHLAVSLEQRLDLLEADHADTVFSGHYPTAHLDDGRAWGDGGVIQVHFASVVQQDRRTGPFASGRRNAFGHHAATELPVLAGTREPVVHLCPTVAIVPIAEDVVVAVLVEVLRVVWMTIGRQGEDHRPAIDGRHVTVQIAQGHGVPDEHVVVQRREIRADQRLSGGGIVCPDFQRVGAGPEAGLMRGCTEFFSGGFHKVIPRP
ncbi:hypothetical protein D3C78_999050 [compost metagenome]